MNAQDNIFLGIFIFKKIHLDRESEGLSWKIYK